MRRVSTRWEGAFVAVRVVFIRFRSQASLDHESVGRPACQKVRRNPLLFADPASSHPDESPNFDDNEATEAFGKEMHNWLVKTLFNWVGLGPVDRSLGKLVICSTSETVERNGEAEQPTDRVIASCGRMSHPEPAGLSQSLGGAGRSPAARLTPVSKSYFANQIHCHLRACVAIMPASEPETTR